MGSQCVGANRDPPDPREILRALADGATALRLLARDSAFDNRRFLLLGSRDEAAARAHKRYMRLRSHADMLTQLADELAQVGAATGAIHSLTPDEAHPSPGRLPLAGNPGDP